MRNQGVVGMTELSTPPDREVEWMFLTHRDTPRRRRQITVRARSWFAARDIAAMKLRVGRDEVEVVR